MKTMRALRPIHGMVMAVPGQIFVCANEVAESYASRGLAEYVWTQSATFERKDLQPVEPPVVQQTTSLPPPVPPAPSAMPRRAK